MRCSLNTTGIASKPVKRVLGWGITNFTGCSSDVHTRQKSKPQLGNANIGTVVGFAPLSWRIFVLNVVQLLSMLDSGSLKGREKFKRTKLVVTILAELYMS